MTTETRNAEDVVIGCLLGTAVGDAIGLPWEGLSADRANRLRQGSLRQRFLFGHGMVSDDTEHSCMLAQSLISCGNDPELLANDFARRLKWWFASLPAGIGLATARACIKLLVGVSFRTSGVHSAGNGSAMRSAILGCVVDNPSQLHRLVSTTTRITHTDPRAEWGAFAVALAAFHAKQPETLDANRYFDSLRTELQAPESHEFLSAVECAMKSASRNESTKQFATQLGCGNRVTGFVMHTVPVCLHAWFCHFEDYRAAISAVVECGGDTDTTAAIVGGIVGCRVTDRGIPAEWLNRIWDWPYSVNWMRNLGQCLARSFEMQDKSLRSPQHFWPATVVRNVFFLVVVLVHCLRRFLPPY